MIVTRYEMCPNILLQYMLRVIIFPSFALFSVSMRLNTYDYALNKCHNAEPTTTLNNLNENTYKNSRIPYNLTWLFISATKTDLKQKRTDKEKITTN